MSPPFARRPGTSDHDPRWALVGGCPTPGSPTALVELAGEWSARAATAQDEVYPRVDALGHGVGDTGWAGSAADAFAARFGRLPPRLVQLADAMEAGHRVLEAWAEELVTLKSRATQALATAEAAHQRREAAQAAIDAAGENDDVSDHVAARDRAATELAAVRRQCEALREAHEAGSRQAGASIEAAIPEAAFYTDDLHQSLVTTIGGADTLATLTSGDAAAAHADIGPPPLGWIGVASALTGALRHVGGASQAAAHELLPAADGTAATPRDGLDDLSRHPRVPVHVAEAAAAEVEDIVIPTVPVLPVHHDVVAATLPDLHLADIPVPRPLRYFDWFEAAEAAEAAAPTRPVHAAPDLDLLLGEFQQGGGQVVAAPIDPAPVRP